MAERLVQSVSAPVSESLSLGGASVHIWIISENQCEVAPFLMAHCARKKVVVHTPLSFWALTVIPSPAEESSAAS
jgi:hypothetical protein